MLASSSAASTSSSTQKGTGRTSSMAISRATAVSARSPPESIARGCRFLPGGRAVISTPVVVRSHGSVSEARPRRPRRAAGSAARTRPRGPRTCRGTARVMSVLERGPMSSRVSRMARSRSSRCASRDSRRSRTSASSSAANGLLAPSSLKRRRRAAMRARVGASEDPRRWVGRTGQPQRRSLPCHRR